MQQHILEHRENGIVTITLNDPERRNAQSQAMGEQFGEAIDRIQADPTVRALIITGAGKVFCAGGDLDMLEAMLGGDAEENRRQMDRFYRYFLCVADLEIPTIAAINGAAIGAGLSFTLACDLRVVAQDAKLGFTYINLGLHPGMGTCYLLPRLVGMARAYEMAATGNLIDGREAERIGLVNAAVPVEEVLPTARMLAERLLAQPDSTLRTTKHALYAGLREGLEQSLRADAIAQTMSFASPEMRRRITAARSKSSRPR